MKDRTFIVSIGKSRTEKKWERKTYTWGEFVDQCSNTTRTKETAEEYAKMSRNEQSEIKDVGGFVAGSLNGGRRKKENVTIALCLRWIGFCNIMEMNKG